jgi:hypothetical protein
LRAAWLINRTCSAAFPPPAAISNKLAPPQDVQLASDNPAMAAIFEVVKIGALPLANLVITFYFPNKAR